MANGHRQALYRAHTLDFALGFLWADAPGDGWQRVVAQKGLRGGGQIAFSDKTDELGDIHAYRAAGNAFGVFAFQATLPFDQRELLGETEVDLIKISCARLRLLFRHLLALVLHSLFERGLLF